MLTPTRAVFFETGLSLAFRHFNPYILAPERFAAGLKRLKQVVHHGGHTTIGDMAIGMFNLNMEWDTLVSVLERDDTPFRVQMIPQAISLGGSGVVDAKQLRRIDTLKERNTHRLMTPGEQRLFGSLEADRCFH